MTSNPRPGPRILGSLRSAGGKGVAHVQAERGQDDDDDDGPAGVLVSAG